MTPTERADSFISALDAYLVAWQEALAGYGPQPEVREELRRAVVGLATTDELARALDPTWPQPDDNPTGSGSL